MSVNLSLQLQDATSRAEPGAGQVVGRLGPNSVLQTWRALDELEAPQVKAAIAAAAGVPDPLPPGLIDEALFLRLIKSVRQALPPQRASAVLRRSGFHTAAYVSKNRIPGPVRAVLAVLPRRLAVPALLKAFAAHAWTFAGSGRFSVAGRFPGVLCLEGAPTARVEAGRPSEGFACSYYEAAFEGLLSIAAPGVGVREVACQAAGASRCEFEILLTHPNPRTTP